MAIEDSRSLVLEWLQTGADYDQGIILFRRFGINRNMTSLFPGKRFRLASKLRYELCKSVGLDWRNLPELGYFHPAVSSDISNEYSINEEKEYNSLEESFQIDSHPDLLPGETGNEGSTDDNSQYPVDVRRIIHEYGESYRQRGKLHFQMSGLPETNEPEFVTQRKDLLSQIKRLSSRMEVLFAAKSVYLEKGILPNVAKLWPPDKSQDGVSEKQLPDSPDELRRLKKNLQTYNVKDNNLLLYQSISVQPVRHPMPSGPRRLGIEKRMAARTREIERIDYKLAGDAH